MKTTTCLFSAALSLLMLLGLLAACGEEKNEAVITPAITTAAPAPGESSPETTLPEETGYPGPVIENVNFNGKIIRVMSLEENEEFPYNEIRYGENSGDVLNDAIFKRNAQITEKYGIILDTTQVSTSKSLSTFTNAINAGNNDFHFASTRICDIMSLASQGMLADVADLPYLDLDAPWYYQNLREKLSIGGEEYLLASYLNMRIFDTLTITAYNKKMAEQFEIEDLNQLVLDGKWTFARMKELCTNVGADLNNDGKFDGNDRYGIVAHSGHFLSFFCGMNGTFIEKNSEDYPVYVGITERNETLLSEIASLLHSQPMGKTGSSDSLRYDPDPFFINNQLFDPHLIYGMRALSEWGVEYGIIPMPKADEAQETYSSITHCKLASVVGIPENNYEMDMTCAILAELMYRSYEIIYPAHIEKTMQLRFAPDEVSTAMLKTIFNSATIDLSMAMNLSCDSTLRTMGNVGISNFAVAFNGIKKQCETGVQNYIKGFTDKKN